MIRIALVLAVLCMAACLDPPRQDLRDQWAEGGRVDLPGAQPGLGPPGFAVEPEGAVQRIRVEVKGLQQGWLQIHQKPTFIASILGLAPKALHVQPFDRPTFTVEAPGDLRATVLLDVSSSPFGLTGDPDPNPRHGSSEPVELRGEDVLVAIVTIPGVHEDRFAGRGGVKPPKPVQQ